MSVLPFDFADIIREELDKGRRENDGLLHASSHLTGSLRHAQLDVVGAPKVENDLISNLRMFTGTMYHTWLANTLRANGVPFMAEVNLTPWMPSGWGGTADYLILNPDLDAFVLADLKTTKGEGMYYIIRDGAKLEHKWQLSMYWHAAKKMFASTAKIAKVVAVLYLPLNDTRNKEESIEPTLVHFEPIPLDELMATAEFRATRVAEYRAALESKAMDYELCEQTLDLEDPATFLNEDLEPVQERIQSIYFDRKTETYDVKLMPHWSAQFCPFPIELCDCSTQGQTKIGMYEQDGTYIPRTGYEDIVPTVSPN